MKAQKSKKNLQEFESKKVNLEELQFIKGGQGNFIVVEDAEGI